MEISIFKTILDVSKPYNKDVMFFLNRIKNGSKSKDAILRLRETQDENYKKTLPVCTFCGTFNYRNKNGLVKFSGLACLDFDKFTSFDEANEHKNNIIKNNYVFCAFISPSGKGVKVLVRVVDEPENYENIYLALTNEFQHPNIDASTKDISRCCFESYDPDLYLNENSLVFDKKEEVELSDIGNTMARINVPLRSENRIIDNIQKWFDRKYSMISGDRNNNVFKFACALNTFGINELTAKQHLGQYAQKDFSYNEISNIVKNVYKNYKSDFNTKAFEDKETHTKIKDAVNKGKKVKDIIRELQKENNPIAGDEELCVEVFENIKNTDDDDIFWAFNEKGKLNLVSHKFDIYLKNKNFFKYYPESNQDTFIFVRKESNLIEVTNKDKIKDFVLNDLRKRDGIGYAPFDYMTQNTKYFSNEYLNMIEAIDIEIKRDTAEQCFLYYNNLVVEIGKDYVKEIDYLDIEKCVWKKTIINRDYRPFDHHKSIFRSFIWYISGQNQDAYNSFKSAIGYLLHSYKTTANNVAIILNDEVITDTPNGRSGKGLFFTALKHLKKVDSIDGKDFSFEKSFKFQTVSTDCQVLVFDDVKRNFEFERLFSIITEGLDIEYKNQGTIKLPVEKSPKIVITTNYTIKGEGGSFDARKFELELSSYFNKNYTPIDKFGHRLFDEWDKDEWSRFDNYMIQCVQYYLNNGLIKQTHKNLELRKFMTETSNEFYEWANIEDTLPLYTKIYNKDVMRSFIDEYPDFHNLKGKTFQNWIKKYCEFYGYVYQPCKTPDKINGRYFHITKNETPIQDDSTKEFWED